MLLQIFPRNKQKQEQKHCYNCAIYTPYMAPRSQVATGYCVNKGEVAATNSCRKWKEITDESKIK